jgi:hypothetical protein
VGRSLAWVLLLAAGLGAPLARAGDEKDGYGMADVGATAWLPPGWSSVSWADHQLVAESGDRSIRLRLWTTPFQVRPDEAAARAWADAVVADYQGQGHGEVGVVESGLREQAGRPTAWARLRFQFQEDPRQTGIVHLRSVEGAGQVIHLSALSAARNAAAAEAAIDRILGELRLDKPPLDTSGDQVETAAGFAATLPAGWRAPLAPELPLVRKATAALGEDALPPERCWAGIRPPLQGERPDVVFACQLGLHLDPVDAHSFADIEAELHTRFFGRADEPVPAAAPVQVGDRMGFLWAPPVKGDAVRLVLAPYDGGTMMLWGLGAQLDGAALDGALQALLPTVRFTGEGGGHPIIGFDRRVATSGSRRRSSPLVIGPALLLLALVGAGVALARRPRKDPFDAA